MDLQSIDWNQTRIYLEVICASFTVIGVLYRIFIHFWRKIKEEYNHIVKIHGMIEHIFAELTPNHGSSLKDKVNKIEKDVQENTDLTKKICSRQRWILDNRDEMIFECNDEGMCTWVNEKYCFLMQRDVSYFIDNGWKNAVHEEDRDRVSTEWEHAVKDKRGSQMIYRIVSKEGETYEVEAFATATDKFGYMGHIKILKKIS